MFSFSSTHPSVVRSDAGVGARARGQLRVLVNRSQLVVLAGALVAADAIPLDEDDHDDSDCYDAAHGNDDVFRRVRRGGRGRGRCRRHDGKVQNTEVRRERMRVRLIRDEELLSDGAAVGTAKVNIIRQASSCGELREEAGDLRHEHVRCIDVENDAALCGEVGGAAGHIERDDEHGIARRCRRCGRRRQRRGRRTGVGGGIGREDGRRHGGARTVGMAEGRHAARDDAHCSDEKRSHLEG